MVHKNFVFLAFCLDQLGFFILIQLPLNLVNELHGFHPVLRNRHAGSKVGCQRVSYYNGSYITDFSVGIVADMLAEAHLV